MRAFVPVGATTRYQCPLTGVRRGLLLPPGTNVKPFVPRLAFPRYKRAALSRSVRISCVIFSPPPPAFFLPRLFLFHSSLSFSHLLTSDLSPAASARAVRGPSGAATPLAGRSLEARGPPDGRAAGSPQRRGGLSAVGRDNAILQARLLLVVFLFMFIHSFL
jgi:hypothetical protein